MLTNFLNPWILGRVIVGLTVVSLCCVGLVVAARVLERWKSGSSAEQQLALERQAELISTTVQLAAVLSVVGMALSVLAAERLTGAIRGAMCAYGVLGSTHTGFFSLLMSIITAVICAQWVIFHRLDLRYEEPLLTHRKFFALFLVAPFVLIDFWAVVRFGYDLDFSVVASCCSVWLDGEAASSAVHVGQSARELAVAVACALVIATMVLAWRVRKGAGKAVTYLAATASVAAVVAAMAAIIWYVAPHAYGTPHHLCPFCLLKTHVGAIGWPLFAGLFVALSSGVGLALVRVNIPENADSGEGFELLRRLSGWTIVSFAVVMALAALPVARYLVASGGVSVFGES